MLSIDSSAQGDFHKLNKAKILKAMNGSTSSEEEIERTATKTAQLLLSEILTPPATDVKLNSQRSNSQSGPSDHLTLRSSSSGEEQASLKEKKLNSLIRERDQLRLAASQRSLKHLMNLMDKEIDDLRGQTKDAANDHDEKIRGDSLTSAVLNKKTLADASDPDERVVLTEKIIVPVDKYPNYNFVGRILGPRGMTAKQLERDTGCKIFVRGRNSGKSSSQWGSGRSPISLESATNTPLHVEIECVDAARSAADRLANAVRIVQQLLSPPKDGKDELKRKQLVDIAIINGTFRPTPATSFALQRSRQAASTSPQTPLSALEAPMAGLKLSPKQPKTTTTTTSSTVYRLPQQQHTWLSPFFERLPSSSSAAAAAASANNRKSSLALVSEMVEQTKRVSSTSTTSSSNSPLSPAAIAESLNIANSLLTSHKVHTTVPMMRVEPDIVEPEPFCNFREDELWCGWDGMEHLQMTSVVPPPPGFGFDVAPLHLQHFNMEAMMMSQQQHAAAVIPVSPMGNVDFWPVFQPILPPPATFQFQQHPVVFLPQIVSQYPVHANFPQYVNYY